MSRKTKESSPQLRFEVEEDKLKVPEHLSNLPQGDSVLDILRNQRLFQARPKGRLLLQDPSSQQAQALEPNSFQVQEISPESKEKFAGAIIITPPLEQKGLLQIAGEVFSAVLHLKPESPIFVLERKGEDQTKGPREKVLKETGLVERKVLTQPRCTKGSERGHLLWRARTEAKRPSREPVNLLAGRLGRWLKEIVWQGVIKDYKAKGFRVLSGEEIGDKLRHSTLPPLDVSSLRQGFGVKVRDTQGRGWRVTLRGSWVRAPEEDDLYRA